MHYAGKWGRASTVQLLLSRGAEVDLMGGPREHPGTAPGWTAWGSRELPGAEERLDGYLGAAAALLEAGERVGEGMLHVAADEVAVLLEEAASRSGIVRATGLSYAPGKPGSSYRPSRAATSTRWCAGPARRPWRCSMPCSRSRVELIASSGSSQRAGVSSTP